VTLILAGVAVNFFFSALNLALQYTADPYATRNILLWLMGDLSQANATRITQALPFCTAGALLALLSMRDMNALVLGEETAASLGVEVRALRRNLFLSASTLTAGAIAAAGPITFVGLVVPHTVRLLFGPDHRILVPCSAFLGGAFLVLCDLPCRLEKTWISEPPVGIVTALLGCPFFVWLLKRRRRPIAI
jgi:iron complex transport system permease protein